MKSTTYLLDKVLTQKREQQEKQRVETIEKVKTALAALTKITKFKSAFIFGSLVQPGKFSQYSDVDIAFLGLDDKDFFKAMAFLSDKLQRDVDIVQMEKHRFKEKIRQQGILWMKPN